MLEFYEPTADKTLNYDLHEFYSGEGKKRVQIFSIVLRSEFTKVRVVIARSLHN